MVTISGTAWNGAKVAMFHHIEDGYFPMWGPHQHTVETSLFKCVIQEMVQNHRVVSLKEIGEYLSRGKSPPKDYIALTFDDGYRSFFTEVLPLLEEFDVPATLYLSTDLIKRGVAPFEFRLINTIVRKDEINIELDGISISKKTTSTQKQIDAYRTLFNHVYPASLSVRESLLNKIGARESNIEMLKLRELDELSEHSLVTLGAHGHEHQPLAEIPKSVMRNNILECLSFLNKYDLECDHFSYPYGSWDPIVRDFIRQCDFKTGVTTTPRKLKENANPLLIPRFDYTRNPISASLKKV